MNEWMNEEMVVYTYNWILVTLKKEGTLATCDNTDATGGHFAKWKSQWQKDQYKESTYKKHLE